MLVNVLVDCMYMVVALCLLVAGVMGGAFIGLFIMGAVIKNDFGAFVGYWGGVLCLGLPLAYLLEYIVFGSTLR